MSSTRPQLLQQASRQRQRSAPRWQGPQPSTGVRVYRHDEFGQIRDAAEYLNRHLSQLALAIAMALSFGIVIALITGDWWLFPFAAAIHALATSTAAVSVSRMSPTRRHSFASRLRALR